MQIKMKKPGIFFIAVVAAILILASTFYTGNAQSLSTSMVQDTLLKYQDGIYEGQSQDTYTNEPYWGKVRITVENGLLAGVNFMIRDSSLHETFTSKYKTQNIFSRSKTTGRALKYIRKDLLKCRISIK
jgi:uncharacterized protein with FMN-binding domain